MPSYARQLSPNRRNSHENSSHLRRYARNWQTCSLTPKARRLLIRRNYARHCSGACVNHRLNLTGVRRSERLYRKSKDDLEQLYAVPFSWVIGIERCVLYPYSVASRCPGIEHLKRVTTGTKCFRKHTLNCWPLGNRRRSRHRAHRFLPTDRCSEFLCRNSCNQRG